MSDQTPGKKPHYLHVFSTFVPAGPQVRTLRILKHLDKRVRHTVLAMDDRTSAVEQVAEGVELNLIGAPAKAGSLKTAMRLRAVLREQNPDLLLTYNFGAVDALAAAKSMGFRHAIHHEDGFLPDEAQDFKRRRILLRRLFFSGADSIVVISKNLERIAQEHWKVPASKLNYIPNGIDVERFAQDPKCDPNQNPDRSEWGFPANSIVVGAVGHLRPEKNLPRLLRSLAKLQPPGSDLAAQQAPVCALILGDGPERSPLEALTQELGLSERVHFAGYQADPRPFYAGMDLFALTSNTEQAPIALIEAMASGLPCLCTDVGDVGAMLPSSSLGAISIAQPEADVEEQLAGRLKRWLSHPAERAAEGQANLAQAQQEFSAQAMLASYEQLFERVQRR